MESHRGSTPYAIMFRCFDQRIRQGNVQLRFEDRAGYLQSVLDALNIPVESQVAVFSKTSTQQERIGPKDPRTIFFNDSTAVAWVRGSCSWRPRVTRR